MRNYSQVDIGGEIKLRQDQFFEAIPIPTGKAQPFKPAHQKPPKSSLYQIT